MVRGSEGGHVLECERAPAATPERARCHEGRPLEDRSVPSYRHFLRPDADVGHAGTVRGAHSGGENANFAGGINAGQSAHAKRAGEGERRPHLCGKRAVGIGRSVVPEHGTDDTHEAAIDSYIHADAVPHVLRDASAQAYGLERHEIAGLIHSRQDKGVCVTSVKQRERQSPRRRRFVVEGEQARTLAPPRQPIPNSP
jgi:hypothetical protein